MIQQSSYETRWKWRAEGVEAGVRVTHKSKSFRPGLEQGRVIITRKSS